MKRRSIVQTGLLAAAAALHSSVASCSGPARISDPVAVIANPEEPSRRQLQAMNQLDALPADPEYLKALRRPIALPGYSLDVRKASFERLYELDREALLEQLELTLPRQENLEWRAWVCGRVAALDWRAMTTTLIRAWAAPIPAWQTSRSDRPERPERLALEQMYGADRLPAVLLREFVESDPAIQANLRMRCWELLVALGQTSTLRALVIEGSIGPRDPLLRQIRPVVTELGVMPCTREELLWARRIGGSEGADYRTKAAAAIAMLPPERRDGLRIRDLNAVVAAAAVEPALLTESDEALYERLESRLESRQAGKHRASFEGYGPENFTEALRPQRRQLTWTDLVAMHLALDALDSEAMRSHLFDLAERDLLDRTTEYGGMISLDAANRFELIEFPPRARTGDLRYEGPPELFEALAMGLFHLHLHCQKFDNGRYAGPHLGDFQLADASGANCLVLTFIDSKTLDADWYRHGRVAVDLGTIQRPER